MNSILNIYNISSNNGGNLIAKLDWVGDKKLRPFQQFSRGKSPVWWRKYNDVKHTWSSSLEQANMDTVLNSLAGAFLLNAVHYPSIKHLWKMGDCEFVIGTGTGLAVQYLPEKVVDELLTNASSIQKPVSYDHKIETDLFLFVMKK